jgi:hypothetical protein
MATKRAQIIKADDSSDWQPHQQEKSLHTTSKLSNHKQGDFPTWARGSRFLAADVAQVILGEFAEPHSMPQDLSTVQPETNSCSQH